MSADIRARLDAMQARAEAAHLDWDRDDSDIYVQRASVDDLPALLGFARDVLDLADQWIEEDGPHPSHDHRCPDDLRDEIRALAAHRLGTLAERSTDARTETTDPKETDR